VFDKLNRNILIKISVQRAAIDWSLRKIDKLEKQATINKTTVTEEDKSEAEQDLTKAMAAVKAMEEFRTEVNSLWGSASTRVLGRVLLAPPISFVPFEKQEEAVEQDEVIHAGQVDGVSTVPEVPKEQEKEDPPNIIEDWSVIEINRDSLGPDFKGNFLDLGGCHYT
jgi:hypothetical protein